MRYGTEACAGGLGTTPTLTFIAVDTCQIMHLILKGAVSQRRNCKPHRQTAQHRSDGIYVYRTATGTD